MANELQLMDMIAPEDFKHIESVFRKNFSLPIEATNADGTEIRKVCSKDCHPKFCKAVRNSPTGYKRCKQDRIRSLRLAFETGQPYISLCHAGIVLVCIPIMDHDTPLGGLFFGKCLWEEFSDDIRQDINKRLKGLKIHEKDLSAENLPIVKSRTIQHAADFLFILLYETTKLDPLIIQWRRQRTEQQAEIGEFIKERKNNFQRNYLYDHERELIAKVKIGDSTGAKEILNALLGNIMLRSPADLNVLKARLVELLTVLNRSAAEGGVDINLLLEKNLSYITKVLTIDTQEDLCAWISNALNDFLDSVYSTQDSRKMLQIKPAIDYIEQNYDKQLSLSDIAKSAFLSVSRISHLFKDEMGITLIDYLTTVRINHAKRLLLTTDDNCTKICYDIGYNNQSYFTRTFKEATSMTPRQFRDSNSRPK
jgi:two-component system response regulator YesN